DLLLDGLAREPALVRTGTHRRPDLGGEHRLLAAVREGLADDHLRLALGVAVGRVDEVDAGVQGAMDDADALFVVRVSPTAEHHRSQAERRDHEAAMAEVAVVHALPLPRKLRLILSGVLPAEPPHLPGPPLPSPPFPPHRERRERKRMKNGESGLAQARVLPSSF